MVITSRSQYLYTKDYQSPQLLQEKIDQAKYLLSRVGSVLKLHRPKTMVDIGCGLGVTLQLFSRELGTKTLGLDINQVAIAKCASLGIKAIRSDIERPWPVKNDSIDLVTIIQTIEHVVDTDHILIEASRILTSRGLLLITTPNLAAWFNRVILLLGYQPFFTEVSVLDKTLGLRFTRNLTPNRKPLGHIRVFTLPALIDLLKTHHFRPILIKGGQVNYLPKFMHIFDHVFSGVPSLATDLIILAQKT